MMHGVGNLRLEKVMEMNFQPTTQSLKRSLRKWIMSIESEWKIQTENRIFVIDTCLEFFRNLRKSCITNVLHSFTQKHTVVITNTNKCYVYTKLYKIVSLLYYESPRQKNTYLNL